MKKRSMLAVASLATGFVVAAVTPSHSLESDAVGVEHVKDTLTTLNHAVSDSGVASVSVEKNVPQRKG
ncbi:hypothetical protein G5C60_00425 [Streptomyces sp. HC44]|uniref:Secreted protein n=1 Tax=Streptomyces scabichelini TaxID=2711217 RepID=A0A6G4UWN8_9ACTN|nr:hypothetical protein [Streptomyces scabichelini]NGO06182.1 hypothetical protein [Streptomyces scabichelini]